MCDRQGVTTYGYDIANRLTKMALPTGSCTGTISLCTTFAYNPNGRRTLTTFPSGATQNFEYDDAGNLTKAIGKDPIGEVETNFIYTYSTGTMNKNDTSLRQSMAEADPVAPNTTWAYLYDSSNRLTDATPSPAGSALHYRYDGNGNRCRTDTTACQGGSDPYQYNAANELTSLNGSSYVYDANGNQTSGPGGASFSYNAKNQTTAMTDNSQTLNPLTYADVGQAERTVAGSTSFTSTPLGVDNAYSGSSHTYTMRDATGGLIGEKVPDGTRYYYFVDGLGSVVAVMDSVGTIVNRYGYDPYGKSTFSSGSVENPWRYAGGYLDATGLYKFGNRYYDPSVGRWTQQDTVGGGIANPASLNRYVYVGDNPCNSIDPTGRSCESAALWMFVLAAGLGAGLAMAPATWGLSEVAAFLLGAGIGGAGLGMAINDANSQCGSPSWWPF